MWNGGITNNHNNQSCFYSFIKKIIGKVPNQESDTACDDYCSAKNKESQLMYPSKK